MCIIKDENTLSLIKTKRYTILLYDGSFIMKRALIICVAFALLCTITACATGTTDSGNSVDGGNSVDSDIGAEVDETKLGENILKDMENMGDDDTIKIIIELQGLEGIEDERGLIRYTEALNAFRNEHIPAERHVCYMAIYLERIECEATKAEIEYYTTLDMVWCVDTYREAILDDFEPSFDE